MSKALQIATTVVSWTSFLAAIGSCVLRCCCCKMVKRKWKADDFMSLVVGAFLLGASALWQRALSLGCSKPEPNNCDHLDSNGDILTWLFVSSMIFDALLHFVIRMAFFTFYMHISAQSDFRFCVGMGFGMNGMLLIFNVLIIVFRCKPVSAAFRPMEGMNSQCMDSGFALFAPAILNSLLNLYVLILPMPTFYSIQLPTRRKIHICCMFTIGGVAVALGFIRIRSLRTINIGRGTPATVGEMMILGALGMSLAAIAHNLPSLIVLWGHIANSRPTTRRRLCNVKARGKLQGTTMYGFEAAVCGINRLPRRTLSTASVTRLVDRPLPALPVEARYPVVNDGFGSQPRTPPRPV
ncbi:hypothetical protein OPT61_g8517 [Boeremia exigua]|uniref:Uncharacterized protein n=1 Tax=Boeremia exigua TaxID=749465 RepID=A0ACC2HYS8_9PLEO|nr:hypothetical protein OPT61_g8517 [Boeremia exigua]